MSYAALQTRFKKVSDLEHALAMLTWDDAVMMPVGGGSTRADSMATLSGMIHEIVASDATGDLARAAAHETLDEWQRANVAEILRAWERARALPADLVVAFAKGATRCEQAWRGFRAQNDWRSVAPMLTEVMALARERATCLGEALDLDPYDACLDEHEPGLNQGTIDPLFERLGNHLPQLAQAALAKARHGEPPPGPFGDEGQATLGRRLMERIGFDFTRGRLDISHHPFCGGDPDDTRITTRFNADDFLESMYAVLHETGHALYEQGLPAVWRGQPVGGACGMALHESQSLLMEMQVCRSRQFLVFAGPIIREALGGVDSDPVWSTDNLTRLATRVQRGFIRVDADEVTYPLHIILRYEMEKALIDGTLAVADVPEAWNAKMQAYLGLTTLGNDADGCMQDVHWYAGLLGYFPTYTLGALVAAQLFQAAERELGGVLADVESGRFERIVGWLREKVHSKGRLLSTAALIEDVTGMPLGTDAFIAHLDRRYG